MDDEFIRLPCMTHLNLGVSKLLALHHNAADLQIAKLKKKHMAASS